jgi:Methyltransferase domain
LLIVPDTWSMPAGSLDRWREDYERGRPGWPPEVVAVPGLPAKAAVLDLGAGTGKLTRLLVSTFHRVVAVEPAEAMRRLLVTLCPGAVALAGTPQVIPLEDASVDGVDRERLPLLDQVRALLTADEYRRRWGTDVHWARLETPGSKSPSERDARPLPVERFRRRRPKCCRHYFPR